MSAIDILQAKQSLTWWLREWGVNDEPAKKANRFIEDMVERGWQMAPNREERPQPPKARGACTRCGGMLPNCACKREHLAATYDDETPAERMDREAAMAAARAGIVAAKGCGDPTTKEEA